MGLYSWLTTGRWATGPTVPAPEYPPMREELEEFVFVHETEEGRLYRAISRSVCPDCGDTRGFYQGPSGGLSTNIFCMNRECRSGFNVTPVIGTAERIGRLDLDRYPKPAEGK